MAKIKINGDSSGYVEIAAPNAAHNNTLELGPGTKILTDKNTHTGNIGIGTDDPGSNKLQVQGGSALYGNGGASAIWGDTSYLGALSFDGSAQPVIRAASSKSLIFQVNQSTEALRITSDGNVGMGIANPTQESGRGLHIRGASGGQTRIHLTNSDTGDTATDGFYIISQGAESGGASGEVMLQQKENKALKFATNNTERFRIDSGGRLITGNYTTALDTTAGSIIINGDVSGGRIATRGSGSSANTTLGEMFGFWDTNKVAGFQFTGGSDTSNKDDGQIKIYTSDSGPSVAERIRITSGGQVNIGGDLSQTGFTANITRNSSETDILRIKGNGGNAFIRFQDNDSSSNYTIGADDAVGGGGFMVYDRNASAYRLVLSSGGKLGIGVNTPFSRFQSGGHTFSGGNGMHTNDRVGMSNHGQLTGLMLASTYNDGAHPEYGLVFVQGPNTSSYNVWSVSPDGPAKGNSLNFHYDDQATNIHSPGYRKFQMTGEGYFLQPHQPKFRAGRSSNYNPGAGSDIIFNIDSGGGKHNVGNHYNTSNGRFTAPVAGVYTFTAHVIWYGLSSGQNMADCFHIRINGTVQGYSGRRGEYINGETGNGGYYTDFMTYQFSLAANDYVTIENEHNLNVHGNANYTTFSGHLVG